MTRRQAEDSTLLYGNPLLTQSLLTPIQCKNAQAQGNKAQTVQVYGKPQLTP